MGQIAEICRKAQQASYQTAVLTTAQKNNLLRAIAAKIRERRREIEDANQVDLKAASEKKIAPAMLDRLNLNPARFEEMVSGVEKVALLDDPIGQEYDGRIVPSGLKIVKRRVPLGVVAAIYEARPNVTADIAALCLKSGNACVLRGGSEAICTNLAIYQCIREVLMKNNLNPYAVSFLKSTKREDVLELLGQDEFVDVVIPRGGESLHRFCRQNSTIPVIIGGFGVSHIYVGRTADLVKAVPLIINAKVQKPSACNALDTLLIEKSRVEELCSRLAVQLKDYKVDIHAHGECYECFKKLNYPQLFEGRPEDFDTEWLSLAMNVAQVADAAAAAAHLRAHKACHSDAVLSNELSEIDTFIKGAGSACVYVNASTRFTDGGQFGLGAEVAISTQKLHARGPMALTELTTYQYVCRGDYLCRS